MSNNTIVRGLLVPSLKNKPLDGRQDVPTLADIVNIENPYVNFIFPVEETGKWYKVLSLTDKVIDELVIPNGMIDEYEEFGGGMTDTQKQEYLTKSLAEQMYLKKEDAVNEYLNKTEAEADYLKKKNAEETYQPKGNYQPSGDYATKQELEDLENRISQGGGSGEGGGGSFIDAPSDNEVYGRKNGLWAKLVDAPKDGKAYARINGVWSPIESGNALDPMLPVLSLTINSTREEDVTIASSVAHVAYADKEFVLGNGGKMNVPYGLDVTVTFPNVENYTTPESVLFEDVQGDISAEGTYTYLKETLDVYVSAGDGSSVDGQIITMLNSRTSSEYKEVLGGKVSFDVLIGDEVTVSINAKEGGYSKPEDVSFVIGQGGNNVSLVYNKLIIDTIYINNLIADRDSIISGEMNGQAIQAIWNGVHRYLGKIVKKVDETNELVLLDIDQNDNRYYTDDLMIDIESLGNTSYFFTYIPSFAYKITQMSDNIYKVQISYKYIPDSDWNFVEETIISSFPCSDNNVPEYLKKPKIDASNSNFSANGLVTMNLYRYSALTLLLFAKYGINIENKINDEYNAGTFYDGVNNILNGMSISTGKKDSSFVYGENYKARTILGIEQFYYSRILIQGFVATPSSVYTNIAKMYLNSGEMDVIDGEDIIERIKTVELVKGNNYIKSLAITSFFWILPLRGGGTSDTYYKGECALQSSIANGDVIRNAYGISNQSDSYTGGKLLYAINSNPYRIETDREKFNKLTNIWK